MSSYYGKYSPLRTFHRLKEAFSVTTLKSPAKSRGGPLFLSSMWACVRYICNLSWILSLNNFAYYVVSELNFVFDFFCIPCCFRWHPRKARKHISQQMFFFQAGTLIDNELNVKPGTPLNMEVNFQITAHSQGASQYCQGVPGQ